MSQLDKAIREDMIVTLEELIKSANSNVDYHTLRASEYGLKIASYRNQIRVLEKQNGKL